jgi:multidrug efflux system membrane fusion protein
MKSFRLSCLVSLSVGCVVALGASAGCNGGASAAGQGGGRGRGRGNGGEGVPVVTAKAVKKDVPVDVPAIGNVEASTTISVRSQVSGILQEARFKEGDFVKADQHLFTIDARPYQAALEQAEANLKRDEALLAQSEAQLKRDRANADYSRMTAERNSALVERGIVSKDLSEQARAGADAAAATVAADEAAVMSARAQLGAQAAAVANAKVALSYTIIRSPINGRTGNLMVKSGNLVTANSTELMTIAQVEPVFVTFSVPALHLPAIKRNMKDHALQVMATTQEAEGETGVGALSFIDNNVDASTDTVKLKASFGNAEHALWPGQFVRVMLRLATLPGATVVPSQAVQTGQEGQFVFVVTAESTVEQRGVTTGERLDQDLVIQTGLQPGETVVTEGQLRLEPGSRVQLSDGRGGPETGGAPGTGRGRGQGSGPGRGAPAQ